MRTLDAQNRLEISLIENVQREDLNAIETATAYAKLKSQFNLTTAEVAQRVGKSESAIINTMRLLTLPETAKRAMVEHNLKEGQLRPLITASPEVIEQILPRIITEDWSARKVEQYMVNMKTTMRQHQKTQSDLQDDLATELEEKLGMKVKIRTSTRGNGDLMIKFKNQKELEKLCTILKT